MTQGPAMTREEAERAILTGVELVGELKEQGYRLLATGEMGIGNTTTSSAVVSVLLRQEPADVTGRGRRALYRGAPPEDQGHRDRHRREPPRSGGWS